MAFWELLLWRLLGFLLLNDLRKDFSKFLLKFEEIQVLKAFQQKKADKSASPNLPHISIPHSKIAFSFRNFQIVFHKIFVNDNDMENISIIWKIMEFYKKLCNFPEHLKCCAKDINRVTE
jgi:hypothetical protein